MHGNPLYHWIALAISSALLLPLSAALLLGWVPPWLRKHTAGLRLRAFGLLSLYAATLVNGAPRLVGASYETVMVSMAFGIGFFAFAGVVFLLAGIKDTRARS